MNARLRPPGASPAGSISAARLVAAAAGTPFLDGWSTASAAFLIVLVPGLDAFGTGLLTSLYYVGFAIGSTVVGRLSDRIGRRPLFLAAMAAVALLSLAELLLPASISLAALLVMRAGTGFVIGGDHPVGQALVSELTPETGRSRALTCLMTAWYVGAISAVLLLLAALDQGLPWQSALIAEAVIAGALLLLRLGVPESPLWARTPKTPAPVRRFRSPAVHDRLANSAKIRRSFLFCAAFWLCQSIPATALMLYGARLLSAISGEAEGFVGALLLYGCFLLGVLPAAWRPLARRPRSVLIGTFIVMAGALALIGATFLRASANGAAGGDSLAASVAFILFALAYGLQTPLDFVIPNRLFPDRLRARLVGMLTTISRAGTLGIAFAFPMLERLAPSGILMLAGAALLALGALLSARCMPREA